MAEEKHTSEYVLELLSARRGHFLLESGHHGDLWLDLETLCCRSHRVQAVAAELATAISKWRIDAVCAPLVEGAFVGLFVASALKIDFAYTERFARPSHDGLFPAGYRVPGALRDRVRGRRVAIVNDVINAGSAVRGTLDDLQSCGADVVGISALLVLGTAISEYSLSKGIPVISMAQVPNHLWDPSECPLCTAGVPLMDVEGFGRAFSQIRS
jgi:orotate phosphoribosyltransferase